MNPNPTILRPQTKVLFEMHPLAHFQRKARQQGPAQAHLRPYQYTIVLLEEGGGRAPAGCPGKHTTSIYFISPGQLTVGPTASSAGTVMQFTDDFFGQETDIRDLALTASLFYRAAEELPLQLAGPSSDPLNFLVNSLRQEVESLALRKEVLVRTYLKAFLIHCLRLREEQAPLRPQPSAGALFLKFRSLLEAHYTVLKTVADYANRLHVTANHLSETIKKETGLTAGSHIRNRVMAEAQRLAESSCLTLKEIAYQLGYDDVAHFSRLFKRCVGLNFSQYKGQLSA